MASLRISSWRVNAACIACGLLSHIAVEPSMSVNRNVTVPVGGLATTTSMCSLLPLRGNYSSVAVPGPSVQRSVFGRRVLLSEGHAARLKRKNLRSTPRTPQNTVGQMPHLWVATLTGVAPDGVWQGDYL